MVQERPLLSGDIIELDDESLLVGTYKADLEALMPSSLSKLPLTLAGCVKGAFASLGPGNTTMTMTTMMRRMITWR